MEGESVCALRAVPSFDLWWDREKKAGGNEAKHELQRQSFKNGFAR
jgi:hypothetical protein